MAMRLLRQTKTSFRPDQLDLAIIDRLRNDPQSTNKAIALGLGVSDITIAQRLRTLSENRFTRVIAQKDIFADEASLAYAAYIYTSGRDVKRIAHQIAEIDEVSTVALSVSGPQIVFNTLVRDHQHMGDIVDDALSEISGIKTVSYDLFSSIHKYAFSYVRLRSPLPPCDIENENLDRDERIWLLLREDGRLSNREVARRLNISETNVRHRLSNMLKAKRIKFAAVSDIAATDHSAVAIVRMAVSPHATKALITNLVALPEIQFLASTSGNYNLTAVVLCENTIELSSLVQTNLSSKNGVVNVDTTLTIKPIKARYDLTRIL
ncbi:MAG: Lrp/AsnC ligand binding domain-containing protein [Pseudomonadota bacterium]